MIRLFIQQVDGKPVIVPNEADLQRLKAKAGDVLIVDAGAVRVTPSTPEIEQHLTVKSRRLVGGPPCDGLYGDYSHRFRTPPEPR